MRKFVMNSAQKVKQLIGWKCNTFLSAVAGGDMGITQLRDFGAVSATERLPLSYYSHFLFSATDGGGCYGVP
jgi:hypothetical protein